VLVGVVAGVDRRREVISERGSASGSEWAGELAHSRWRPQNENVPVSEEIGRPGADPGETLRDRAGGPRAARGRLKCVLRRRPD